MKELTEEEKEKESKQIEKIIWIILLSMWIGVFILFIVTKDAITLLLFFLPIMMTAIWGLLYFCSRSYDKEQQRVRNENDEYYQKMNLKRL